MKKRDQSLVRRMLQENQTCELCNRTSGLDVHHIIPLSCTLGSVNLDTEENMIVLCQRCHSRLTSRRLLTMLGVEKTKFDAHLLLDFYEKIQPEVDGCSEVCDYADDMAKSVRKFLHIGE